MKKSNHNNDNIIKEIKNIATRYKIQRIILFGSRSRGDNKDTSDYDIAVYDTLLDEKDKTYFYHEINKIETLKKIDIVYINDKTDKEFLKNIKKDGVVIYEQTRDKAKKL